MNAWNLNRKHPKSANTNFSFFLFLHFLIKKPLQLIWSGVSMNTFHFSVATENLFFYIFFQFNCFFVGIFDEETKSESTECNTRSNQFSPYSISMTFQFTVQMDKKKGKGICIYLGTILFWCANQRLLCHMFQWSVLCLVTQSVIYRLSKIQS